MSLAALHVAIQVAMDWNGGHMHAFEIDGFGGMRNCWRSWLVAIIRNTRSGLNSWGTDSILRRSMRQR